MPFRVGKLAVDVAEQRMAAPGFCQELSKCYGYTRCIGETRICFWPTIIGCRYFITRCFGFTIGCPYGSIDPCDWSFYREDPGMDPGDLRTLVDELRNTLPMLEEAAKKGGFGGPQTVEQAEVLEQHLQSALKEVQAQKESLRKGTK